MYYAAILAVWGLWRIIRKQGVDSTFRGALVIGGVLVVVQGILGVILYFFSELTLARQIHILYGALSALVVPAAYIYTRGDQERREMVILGVATLILVALTIRALQTAGPLLILE
jgi:CDP-diglyceride synthetase